MAHLISHSRMSGFLACCCWLSALGPSICHPHGLPPAEFWPPAFPLLFLCSSLSRSRESDCPGGVQCFGTSCPAVPELGALSGLNLEKDTFLGVMKQRGIGRRVRSQAELNRARAMKKQETGRYLALQSLSSFCRSQD